MRNGWHAAPAGSIAGLAAAALVMALVSACGDDAADEANEANDDTPSSTAEPTPTTLSPEDEVEQAYLEFWDMGVRLAENPDPDDPELAERATGEALGDMTDRLTTMSAANQRVRIGPGYAHEVRSIEVDGDRATLAACVTDDAALIDATTGSVITEGSSIVELSVAVVRSAGVWKVDAVTEEPVDDRVGACG